MKPIRYYLDTITRNYYRTLDFTQRAWVRFSECEVGRAVIWLAPRALKVMWISLVVSITIIVIVYSLFFVFLLALVGQGKPAFGFLTKVTLFAVGLFAVVKVANSDKFTKAVKEVKAIAS